MHHRLLLVPKLFAKKRSLADRKSKARLGNGNRGFGLLDTAGDDRRLARGALGRIARVLRRLLQLGATSFGGPALDARSAQGGKGLGRAFDQRR